MSKVIGAIKGAVVVNTDRGVVAVDRKGVTAPAKSWGGRKAGPLNRAQEVAIARLR